MTEYSVGLIIITRLAGVTGELEPFAVLQRRGDFNHETLRAESWPGLCQVTAHGKLNGEGWTTGLHREIKEELGSTPFELGIKYDKLVVVKEIKVNQPKAKTTRTYAVEIPADAIKKFRLNASTGGLVLVNREQAKKIQTTASKLFGKETGVPLREQIVMFPDELEAVEAAFRKFS